jgi:hypothetical protein
MQLMTEALRKRFAAVGCQDGKKGDALVIARFFHPLSSWIWYATEYDPETRCFFGYVCGFDDEWGDFSLDEMESVKLHGLGIERDIHFEEKPLRDALREDGKKCPKWMDRPAQADRLSGEDREAAA